MHPVFHQIEHQSFGFDRLVIKSKDGGRAANSLKIMGKNKLERLVIKFFELLGKVFNSSLKPIDVKVEVQEASKELTQTTVKTTRAALENFLLNHGRLFCRMERYPSALINSKNLSVFIDDAAEVSLPKLTAKVERYIRKKAIKISPACVIDLVNAAGKTKGFDLPVYVNPKTAQFSFQDPQNPDWLQGRIYLNNDYQLRGEFPNELTSEDLLLLERFLNQFDKALKKSKYDVQKALDLFRRQIVQKEFDEEIDPVIFDQTPYNQSVAIQMKMKIDHVNENNEIISIDGEMPVSTEANDIELHGNRYIAVSQPLEEVGNTHFWEILFQKECPTIVKLTKTKPGQAYWPDKDLTLSTGLKVELTHEEPLSEILMTRTFTLSRGNVSRKVTQLDFNAWPDMQPPKLQDFKQLLAQVEAAHKGFGKNTPILVHCGAGIGRTGTFIVAHGTRDIEKPDYKQEILHVRRQRPNKQMVETPEQYDFLLSLKI